MSLPELSRLFGNELLADFSARILVVLSSTDHLDPEENMLIKKIIGSTGNPGFAVRYKFYSDGELISWHNLDYSDEPCSLVFIFQPKSTSGSRCEALKQNNATRISLPSIDKIAKSDVLKREVWTTIKSAVLH